MNTHKPLNPSDITTLYIVRHGQSLDNAGIPHVHTPEGSPLTDLGRQQAHDVARRLAHIHADAVIASDLIRARQTAEIIAQDRRLPVRIISELHERSIGRFGGIPNLHELEEYRENFLEYERGSQEERMRWKLGDEWESLAEAQTRFVRALEHVVDDYPHKTAIVVAHGTVMRTFLIYAGYGTLEELVEDVVENTGYIVVQTDGRRWTITDAVGIRHHGSLQPAGRLDN